MCTGYDIVQQIERGGSCKLEFNRGHGLQGVPHWHMHVYVTHKTSLTQSMYSLCAESQEGMSIFNRIAKLQFQARQQKKKA
jgi:diadenosine tetraphosphate (Ap4A) HIT family hydrolase